MPSTHLNVRSNRHVALKILTADSDSGDHATFELDILEHIRIKDGSKHGASHILGLLDHFRHRGPHGDHLCLIFKAMGPDLTVYRRLFPDLRVPILTLKQITRQLLLALTYLHRECRIIHTGKSKNVVNGAARIIWLIPARISRHKAAERSLGDRKDQ